MWPFDIKRKRREAAARAEEERQEGLRRLHQQAMDALARQGLSPTGRRRSEPPPAPRPPPTRHIGGKPEAQPRHVGRHPGLDAPYGRSSSPAPAQDDTLLYAGALSPAYSAPAPTPTPSPCPSPSYDSGSSYSSSDSGSCGGGDSGGGGGGGD